MHTPRPWREVHDHAPDWTGDWYIYGSGNKWIVLGEGWTEEHQANARLIAAAPDLLEALEELVTIVETAREEGYDNIDYSTTKPARLAIEKAK